MRYDDDVAVPLGGAYPDERPDGDRVMTPVTIRSVATALVDLPMRRRHSFSRASADHQSYLIVRIESEDGITGLGEGTAPGGPWWGTTTVEAVQAVIDSYLAPVLVGVDATRLEHIHELLARAAPAERAARSALEMASLDLAGKALGLPAYQLLGGLSRAAIPTAWALSARESDGERPEIAERLAAGHRRFKLKAGALDPQADVARALALVDLLGDRADLVVDPNGSWDELTARRCCTRLAAAGVAFVEQPLPAWNVAGLARLREDTGVAIMADESVQTLQDGLLAAQTGFAVAWSLKTQKSGGPLELRRLAGVADACGARLYGGTMLESSIGTAASLHVYASLPQLQEGCELIGPELLAAEVVDAPIRARDGQVTVPHGPGIGVSLDEERLARYARRLR
jgi:muconate cycloisomerase